MTMFVSSGQGKAENNDVSHACMCEHVNQMSVTSNMCARLSSLPLIDPNPDPIVFTLSTFCLSFALTIFQRLIETFDL